VHFAKELQLIKAVSGYGRPEVKKIVEAATIANLGVKLSTP